MFPPIPSWDGIHPLIVHFPVALLIVAPLMLLLGLVVPRAASCWRIAGLLLMLLGTTGAWIAVATGFAAGKLADGSEGFREVLEKHEELAELTRNVYTGLTVAFAAVVLVPLLVRRWTIKPVILAGIHVAFLIAYLVCLLLVANTAHNGGRLVHEFGVRAMITTEK